MTQYCNSNAETIERKLNHIQKKVEELKEDMENFYGSKLEDSYYTIDTNITTYMIKLDHIKSASDKDLKRRRNYLINALYDLSDVFENKCKNAKPDLSDTDIAMKMQEVLNAGTKLETEMRSYKMKSAEEVDRILLRIFEEVNSVDAKRAEQIEAVKKEVLAEVKNAMFTAANFFHNHPNAIQFEDVHYSVYNYQRNRNKIEDINTPTEKSDITNITTKQNEENAKTNENLESDDSYKQLKQILKRVNDLSPTNDLSKDDIFTILNSQLMKMDLIPVKRIPELKKLKCEILKKVGDYFLHLEKGEFESSQRSIDEIVNDIRNGIQDCDVDEVRENIIKLNNEIKKQSVDIKNGVIVLLYQCLLVSIPKEEQYFKLQESVRSLIDTISVQIYNKYK